MIEAAPKIPAPARNTEKLILPTDEETKLDKNQLKKMLGKRTTSLIDTIERNIKIGFIILIGVCFLSDNAHAWWDSNYLYRKQITVTNNDSIQLGTDTIVAFTADTASLISAVIGEQLGPGGDGARHGHRVRAVQQRVIENWSAFTETGGSPAQTAVRAEILDLLCDTGLTGQVGGVRCSGSEQQGAEGWDHEPVEGDVAEAQSGVGDAEVVVVDEHRQQCAAGRVGEDLGGAEHEHRDQHAHQCHQAADERDQILGEQHVDVVHIVCQAAH